MDDEDAEKMSFIIPWETYCYRVMPFGLKNSGATYMRAMTTIFHDMMHKEIEVYVDDVIIKSKSQADHDKDLRNFFERLRRCHQCQVHGDQIHSPPAELHAMAAPWSFVAWGMDVIGPINPKASNGHRFILVAIDYFTKFGVPKMIITDNAANLNSHLIQEVCQQFKIAHQNSTPYCPKANGIVEAANKNIKKILRKMVQGSRQLNEKLSFALLETVIPVEVEIPSLQVIVESEIDDDGVGDRNLNGTSLDSPTRYSPSPFNPLRYLSPGSLKNWANFAGWEPPHGPFKLQHPWKEYLKIGDLVRKCACHLLLLNGNLNSKSEEPTEFERRTDEACKRMTTESSKALKELPLSIKTMT
ncbi:Aluminum-activated malate transporter 8 [Capsicum chinense]|nr:Aluminum-activated malate transporter 8 [Capsicum chinense]